MNATAWSAGDAARSASASRCSPAALFAVALVVAAVLLLHTLERG